MQLFVSTIQLFYYTFFNLFIQREGYSRITHIGASFILLLLLVITFADLFLLSHIIFDTVITFNPPPFSVFLGLILIGVMNYQFSFGILKLQKKGGADDGQFLIAPAKYKLAINVIKIACYGLCLLIGVDMLQHYL